MIKCPFCGYTTLEVSPDKLRLLIKGKQSTEMFNAIIESGHGGISIESLQRKLYNTYAASSERYYREMNTIRVMLVRIRDKIKPFGYTIETMPNNKDGRHVYVLRKT